MEKVFPDEDKFPLQEREALEDFFRSFFVALKTASIYFPEHPSFLKNIEELEKKTRQVFRFRKVLSFGVSSEALLLEGEYFYKGVSPYKEIADFLHKRKVRSLQIEPNISRQEFKFLISVLSRPPRDIAKEGGIGNSLKVLRNVKVEELDYSLLLSAKGSHPQDIWRMLVGKEALLEYNPEEVEYLVDNFPAIFKELKDYLGEVDLNQVLDNLSRVVEFLKENKHRKLGSFTENLSSSLLKIEPQVLEKIFKKEELNKLQNFVKDNLDKKSVIKVIAEDVMDKKEISPLFVQFYSTLAENFQDTSELAENITEILSRNGVLQNREDLIDSLREVFFSDPSNKFISELYKKTLNIIAQDGLFFRLKEVFKDYRQDLEEDKIETDYFYVLMEMLRLEDEPEDLKFLVKHIRSEIFYFLENAYFEVIGDLSRVIKELIAETTFPEKRKILEEFYEEMSSKEFLGKILESKEEVFQNFSGLNKLFKNVKNLGFQLIKKYFEDTDIGGRRRLRSMIELMEAEVITEIIGEFLQENKSVFVLRECIDILSQVKNKQAIRLLEDIYRSCQDNQLLVLDILKAMRFNPHKERDFLFQFIKSRDFFVRKEAVMNISEIAQEEDLKFILERMLGVNNFLGLRNKFIIENIEIFSTLNIREAIPYLLKFIKKPPFMFRGDKGKLLKASFEALNSMEPSKVKEVMPYLASVKDKELQGLISKIKKDGGF